MVNDTVGTMMSCGYKDRSCEIGLIIGHQSFLFVCFAFFSCYMQSCAEVLGRCGKSAVKSVKNESINIEFF